MFLGSTKHVPLKWETSICTFLVMNSLDFLLAMTRIFPWPQTSRFYPNQRLPREVGGHMSHCDGHKLFESHWKTVLLWWRVNTIRQWSYGSFGTAIKIVCSINILSFSLDWQMVITWTLCSHTVQSNLKMLNFLSERVDKCNYAQIIQTVYFICMHLV